ncbi:MAG TPA: 3-deoxy-7-phosphoheptulonate synthase [Candidatus Acidoferrales bacterium]|nr:3-deoxy-7-phosphoheptulonate synthase [Candidatus Acidoferrales bacterium]
MLVVMRSGATDSEVRAACEQIEKLTLGVHVMRADDRTLIAVTGAKSALEASALAQIAGVSEVLSISKPYQLASREAVPAGTLIQIPGTRAVFGSPELVIMAGPCAVESSEQAFAIAERVAAQGAQILRGGAFKPRTSPYSFQGLGLEGLKILAQVRERYGLAIVTEALDHEMVPVVEEYADIIQIGSRNMQNFSLLKRAGRARKPVLLKRGMSATLEEFLMAAEYILSGGNSHVILCERGVRTFNDHSRNTLDLNIIPIIKRLSHLPIVVDPSHGTGSSNSVLPLARAAIAAGCDGLIVEVHNDPARALSDGDQSLNFAQFEEMMQQLRRIAPALDRHVPQPQPVDFETVAK